jgi:hypothetical protein
MRACVRACVRTCVRNNNNNNNNNNKYFLYTYIFFSCRKVLTFFFHDNLSQCLLIHKKQEYFHYNFSFKRFNKLMNYSVTGEKHYPHYSTSDSSSIIPQCQTIYNPPPPTLLFNLLLSKMSAVYID